MLIFGMDYGQLQGCCRTHRLAGADHVGPAVGRDIQPKLGGFGDDIEHTAPCDIDPNRSITRHVDQFVQMHGKRRHVAKRHAGDFAIRTRRPHPDQPGGRLKHQFSYRFKHRQNAGLKQHSHHADGVAARHRRVFGLFHDDEPGIRRRVAWWYDDIAAVSRIPPRLAQHHQANIIGIGLHPLHPLKHRFSRHMRHAASNNTTGFSLGMDLNHTDHS